MIAERLAYTRREAAAMLGISLNTFARHVQPELKVIRRGSVRLFPHAELERWVEENAGRPLEGGET